MLQGTIVFIYLCDTLLHLDIYNMDRLGKTTSFLEVDQGNAVKGLRKCYRLGNTACFLGDDHEKAVRELEKGYRLGNIAWFLGDDHEKAVREPEKGNRLGNTAWFLEDDHESTGQDRFWIGLSPMDERCGWEVWLRSMAVRHG